MAEMSSGGPAADSGALGGVEPSGRGAPGAFGSALGSKASLRLGGLPPGRQIDRRSARAAATTGGGAPAIGAGARRRGGAAEAEFHVLLEALERVFEQLRLVLELLDAPVRLAQIVFEPVEPDAPSKRGRWGRRNRGRRRE